MHLNYKFSSNPSFTSRKELNQLIINIFEPLAYFILEQLDYGPKVEIIINPYVNEGLYIISKDIEENDNKFYLFKDINEKIKNNAINEKDLMNNKNLVISLNELDIISKILDIKDLNFGNFGFLEDKENIGDEKYLRVLYVSKLPRSVTPRFYNRITTIENFNIITTLNITPTNPSKVIKMVNKKISGMKTERLEKIKKANKNNYTYEAVKDEKLEDAIKDAQGLRDALQKKKQKLFTNNMLICIQASSLEELDKATKVVKSIGDECVIGINNLDWQQLEGVQNALPFGWNTLQIQRSLTSESTATNVPFNTKDLMHSNSIFYGINLVSKNPVFCDRKKLLNGNGCILATSGAGKSFAVKLTIEQILLRYPQDEVIVIDPQRRIWTNYKCF